MALIFLAGALGGFAAGVIACNLRDLKEIAELEQVRKQINGIHRREVQRLNNTINDLQIRLAQKEERR